MARRADATPRKGGVNRLRCILGRSGGVSTGGIGGVGVQVSGMRDVIEDEGRKFRPASIVSGATGALLSVAILYNAFFGQGQSQRLMAEAAMAVPPGATTRIDVSAGATVQLKYDPVVEEVQRQLLAAGYYKGMVDGVTGKRTRQAIMAFQQAEGLTVDGEASTTLAERVRYTRQVAEASLFTGDVTPAPDAGDRAKVRRVQTGLSDLSFDPGAITGSLTDATRQAIRSFQHARHLAETGEISDGLIAELGQAAAQPSAASN